MSYLRELYYEQMEACLRARGSAPMRECEKELVSLFLPIEFNVDFILQERLAANRGDAVLPCDDLRSQEHGNA